MINNRTIAGHSLTLNTLALIINFCGVALLLLGFLPAFEKQQLLFLILGSVLTVISVIALIMLKGRLLMATVGRVIVGAIFVVSGLIKANDPIGFSYKLSEYFEDGALAYRIKEWFNAPGFSLESLIDHSLAIAIAICIVEIVIGVLLIVGGKARLTSWLLLITMLFFTFLTWHTATCNASHKFLDRDTYHLDSSSESALANLKIEESKKNKDIHIIAKSATEVVVDEYHMPQCVNDCGCFGDAMKGSVGRSLTPMESFWKDLVLLYLAVWIFAGRRQTEPNSISWNWKIVPVSLLLFAALSWLFDWYFPLLFGGISVFAALWLYRSGGKALGNHYAVAILVTIFSALFIWFCLKYDTLRDYRPYATHTNLRAKMVDSREEIAVVTLYYKNLKTGEIRGFDQYGKDYTKAVWGDKATWKYLRKEKKVISPGKMPSIDSNGFNPFILPKDISSLEAVILGNRIKPVTVQQLRLLDLNYNAEETIDLIDYNVESYPVDEYRVLDTVSGTRIQEDEIRMREYILNAPQIILLVSRDLRHFDRSAVPELKKLIADAAKAKVPVILITSGNAKMIKGFRKSTGLNIAAFSNDETELKVISRSNPALMILKKGIVAGKYPHTSLPTYKWIETNLLTK